MPGKTKLVAGAAVGVLLLAGVSAIAAANAGDDNEVPITGEALQKASAAALAHTGGGRVTETEQGDEESFYEVEVTLDNGDQVDVQLDKDFKVVGSETDSSGEDDDD